MPNSRGGKTEVCCLRTMAMGSTVDLKKSFNSQSPKDAQ
ncbi:hypothetical protein LEMLEM_LOCUS12278 [Lemmus lemmus]